jgi:hypothetical protein
LYRYSEGPSYGGSGVWIMSYTFEMMLMKIKVGLSQVESIASRHPGFNPWAYKLKTRFQAFAFKCNCVYRYAKVREEFIMDEAGKIKELTRIRMWLFSVWPKQGERESERKEDGES